MSTSGKEGSTIKLTDANQIQTLRQDHLTFIFRTNGELDKTVKELALKNQVGYRIHPDYWHLTGAIIDELSKLGYSAKADVAVEHFNVKCPKLGRYDTCNCRPNVQFLIIQLKSETIGCC